MEALQIENQALRLKVAELEALVKMLESRLFWSVEEVSYAVITNGTEMNNSDSKSNIKANNMKFVFGLGLKTKLRTY